MPARQFKLASRAVALRGRSVFAAAALLSLLVFLSTLQLGVNGSEHRYFTDVGEIQNALPRWGTIHFTGYPQFTALGSLFVNGLRLVGLPPAAGASLYSALWGSLATGLLALLIFQFGVSGLVATLAALLFALSTSMWVDGSIAELHTMTMALTFAALWMGVRFRRGGRPADLYWLVFLSSQGLTHQRSFVFLAPALTLLVARHWRLILQKWLPVLALAMTGPITYLYLPLVDWLGSQWVFSAPGTWDGFWALVLDTKAERIVSVPGSLEALLERGRAVVALLNGDWPAPLWVIGLLGLTLARRVLAPVERAALTLTWIAYLLLSLIVWEGFVSDALLATKLPVIGMAAVGLAFIGAGVAQRWPVGKVAVGATGVALALFLFFGQRGEIVALTRDAGARETIAMVEGVRAPEDGRPITLVALWGNDFWQLAYAQAYEGRFPELNVVDHNADFGAYLEQGHHLLTLSRTFLTRPLEAWEERLGDLQLSMAAPGIVEMRRKGDDGASRNASADNHLLSLGNGIVVEDVRVSWWDDDRLLLSVVWRAQEATELDYSVAVHLVSQDPPQGPEHILAQADSIHPVGGWYPTSEWEAGKVVQDMYLVPALPETEPVALRLGMYRQLENGEFENTEMLSLAVP
ncbi:MAG: DUF2723 domain-containing protein [Chloroflexi bacterium]|nr:DUF2723 domain-containing protein [Chloroflexota bacterium]